MQPFMKTMIVLAAIACLAMLGIALAGCTQEHFDTADQVAEVATDIAQGTEAVLDSPVGAMVPQPANGIIRMAGEAVLGLAGLWFANKARVRGVVLRSVVQAVDSPGDTKNAVRSNLRAAGIEAEGRKMISEYKKAG